MTAWSKQKIKRRKKKREIFGKKKGGNPLSLYDADAYSSRKAKWGSYKIQASQPSLICILCNRFSYIIIPAIKFS